MTAELTFAKTFLSILDTKPSKLASDYSTDLRTLELTSAYTLPRSPSAKPMLRTTTTTQTSASSTNPNASSASTAQTIPGSERAVSVALKSTKNPVLDLTLPAVGLSTSVLELKRKVADAVGLESVEKVRLLWKRKPVGDAKTLAEVIASEEGVVRGVEFGVMVIGGVGEKQPMPAVAPIAGTTATPVAQGESGEDVLRTDGFWNDLGGFLEQRVRDQKVAEDAGRLFREAWGRR